MWQFHILEKYKYWGTKGPGNTDTRRGTGDYRTGEHQDWGIWVLGHIGLTLMEHR